MKQTMVITSIGELCRMLSKSEIVITDVRPSKGINGEDLVIIQYQYLEDED